MEAYWGDRHNLQGFLEADCTPLRLRHSESLYSNTKALQKCNPPDFGQQLMHEGNSVPLREVC
jgi:hypothetical protein